MASADRLPEHQPVRALVPTLGLGWDFPVRRREVEEGLFAAAADDQAVRRAIVLILGTIRGERAMRPDFGSGLHRLVYLPNTRATRAAAEFETRDALMRHEPRIEVLDVHTSVAPGHPEMIQIEVQYRVRSTDNRFNFVYPFYLDRAQA